MTVFNLLDCSYEASEHTTESFEPWHISTGVAWFCVEYKPAFLRVSHPLMDTTPPSETGCLKLNKAITPPYRIRLAVSNFKIYKQLSRASPGQTTMPKQAKGGLRVPHQKAHEEVDWWTGLKDFELQSNAAQRNSWSTCWSHLLANDI